MKLPRVLSVILLLVAFTPAFAGSVHLDAAEALYNAQKWQDAIAAYEKALPELEGEEKARVLSQMGYAYERSPRGDDKAIEHYQAAIDAPGSTGYVKGYASTRMGSVLMIGKRDFEKALAVLMSVEQIKGAHPNHRAEALLVSSSAALKAGKPEIAEQQLLKMKPLVENEGATPHSLSEAYLRLGRFASNRKAYDEAIEIFEKVLTLPVASKQKAYAQGYIDELKLLQLGDLPFYIQPYLTNTTHTTADVYWVTQGEFSPGKVIAKDPSGKTFEAVAEVSPIKNTQCFLSRAVLTGLTPNTVYTYSVSCGSETREGRFRANPTPDQDVEVVIGVTGDTQAAPDIHFAVAKEIAKDNIDFLIHVGDLTDHGSTWSKWRSELFEPAVPYLQKGAIWPAVGNHDGGAYFPKLFGMSKEFWTSFDYGPVHVVVLDSYFWGANRKGGRKHQLAWLEEDLKNSKGKWNIVALHVPMVATHTDIDWFGEDDFLPLMEKYGVDMVLSGHHPMYRKYLPLADHDHKPIYHVTTGGGGPTGPPLPSPILEKGSPHPHGTVIRIKGDKLELTSRLTDGSVIDQFVMHKHDKDSYQPTLMQKAIGRTLAKMTRHLYFEMLEERSNNLILGLEDAIEGGKPAQFTFDTSSLPRGPLDLSKLPPDTKLLLKAKTDSGWHGDEVSLPLDAAKHVFSFVAPENVTTGGGNIKPALQMEMTLQVGSRRLETYVANVRLSQEASMLMAAATGGLPPIWNFKLDPDGKGVEQKWYAVDASGDWGKMPVTQWWETTLGKEYDGWGWYRTTVKAPAFNENNHHVWLSLGKVDESMALYVNGQFVAEQIYDTNVDDDAWQKPRRFDVTRYLKPESNVFVVKVQDLFGMGGIYGGAMLKTQPINRLTGGDMSDGLAPWSVTTGDKTASLADLDDKKVSVSIGNAMHVGERAIIVDNSHTGVIRFTRTFEVTPDSKTSIFSARARHRAGGGNGLVVNLYAGDKPAGKPIASLTVPAAQNGSWPTATQAAELKQGAKQKVTVEIVMSQPSVYTIDEVGLAMPE